MMRRVYWLMGFAALFATALNAHAAGKTTARLLVAEDIASPGQTVVAAVQLRMPPRWHTYWRNPGDSGDGTKIDWKLPPGVTAGKIQWPAPEKLTSAGFTTYVYHDQVLLLVPLQLANNVPAGSLELKAAVSWLECEEVCVPGKGDVQANLTVGPGSKPSADAPLIEAWQRKIPLQLPSASAKATWENAPQTNTRPLRIEWTAGAQVKDADFFPYATENHTVKGETEILSPTDGKIRLRKIVEKSEGDWPKEVAGLLVQKGSPNQAFEASLPISPAPELAALGVPRSLWAMLGFAFLGGLILNIMPCVLPVIALKILSFVNQSKEAPAHVRTLGSVYGLGVLVSFAVLAALAIAVQKAGGLASWGMILQNQPFRVVLTVVVTLVALNLFGLFEITLSGSVAGTAGDLAAKEGIPGAFFNGVLATILATPCTAPFLSVAIAFAFTQPPVVTLLVFLATGAGLAAPFVVLCFQPGWLKVLPKPGAWMEKFKIAMGFPMLATAVWLFWFTAPRFGKSGVLWLGLFLVLLAMAAWIWGEFVQRGRSRRGLAIAISLALIASGYFGFLESQLHWRSKVATGGPETPYQSEGPDGIAWERWSPEVLAKARADGHPVLVDFTADNCLNCQVNKRTSLEVTSTRSKLKAINAVALLGDFSDGDERIAAELRRYGRAGVPLVLVYPSNAQEEPIVLPPLLTPGIVHDALEKAAGNLGKKADADLISTAK